MTDADYARHQQILAQYREDLIVPPRQDGDDAYFPSPRDFMLINKERLGLTYDDIAERSGGRVSYSAASRYLGGSARDSTFTTVCECARILQFSLDAWAGVDPLTPAPVLPDVELRHENELLRLRLEASRALGAQNVRSMRVYRRAVTLLGILCVFFSFWALRVDLNAPTVGLFQGDATSLTARVIVMSVFVVFCAAMILILWRLFHPQKNDGDG